MFEGLATAHTCAHSTSNACSNGNLHASVRASDIGERNILPPRWRHFSQEIWRNKSGISITLQQQKMFKTATDTLGLNGLTVYQTRHSGASIDRMRGLRTLRDMQRRGQWTAFSSVTRDDTSSRLATDDLSPAPTPEQAGNTRATCRGIVDKATASPAAQKFMTGKMCA